MERVNEMPRLRIQLLFVCTFCMHTSWNALIQTQVLMAYLRGVITRVGLLDLSQQYIHNYADIQSYVRLVFRQGGGMENGRIVLMNTFFYAQGATCDPPGLHVSVNVMPLYSKGS